MSDLIPNEPYCFKSRLDPLIKNNLIIIYKNTPEIAGIILNVKMAMITAGMIK